MSVVCKVRLLAMSLCGSELRDLMSAYERIAMDIFNLGSMRLNSRGDQAGKSLLRIEILHRRVWKERGKWK